MIEKEARNGMSAKAEAARFRERLIKDFLDLVILNEAMEAEVSGYSIITLIHKRFRFLISSGNVYGMLYFLERKGLLQGVWKERKRVYRTTEQGLKMLTAILDLKDLDLRKLLF